MTTRRNFIQKSGLIAATATLGSLPASTSMTFIHHVLFWAKNPGNDAEKNQLFKALKALGTLPMIQSAHVGKAIVTDFDKPVTEASYSFSVVLVFENAEKVSFRANFQFLKQKKTAKDINLMLKLSRPWLCSI